MRKVAWLLLWGWFLGTWAAVRAAPTGTAVLWQVGLTRYPQAEAYVSVYDPEGRFVPDLPLEAFTVLEDGARRPVTDRQPEHPGLHIVIALNPGRAFAVRDVQGVPRHLYLFYQLQSWLEKEEVGRYDLSLLTLNGPSVTHTEDPRAVLDALTDYYALQSPDFRTMTPQLTPLLHAITQAAAPSPRPGMGRVVLFITAALPTLRAEDIELPRQRAQEAHVQVWIWLIGPPEAQDTQQGRLWAELATATGGEFRVFSGQEVLPDLRQAFAAREGVYHLTYTTHLTQPGSAEVQIQVASPYGDLVSAETRLELNPAPPEVRWLVPPQPVTRRAPTADAPLTAWQPAFQTVEVAVTFPDGVIRPLRRSALWVDGEKVAEHHEAPFERFQWDLTGYTTPGTHRLQIEVEDVLGLVAATPEMTVTVDVAVPTAESQTPEPTASVPPTNPSAIASAANSGQRGLVLGAALVAGMVLAGALLWAWRGTRHRPRPPARPPTDSQSWGVLEPLPPLEPDWPAAPRIPLQKAEVVLGSDPAQADFVLDDRSVSPRHARLWRTPEGQVFLADLRSLAGTWLNYAPVSVHGAPVEPGDVIHVGRFGFRFVTETDA